jgi:hypothetical protein
VGSDIQAASHDTCQPRVQTTAEGYPVPAEPHGNYHSWDYIVSYLVPDTFQGRGVAGPTWTSTYEWEEGVGGETEEYEQAIPATNRDRD